MPVALPAVAPLAAAGRLARSWCARSPEVASTLVNVSRRFWTVKDLCDRVDVTDVDSVYSIPSLSRGCYDLIRIMHVMRLTWGDGTTYV